MNRKHASLVEPGESVIGVGTVAAVKHYPDDSRWSARLTWAEDGSSTMYGPHTFVYVAEEVAA